MHYRKWLILAATLLLSGCGSAPEQAQETASDLSAEMPAWDGSSKKATSEDEQPGPEFTQPSMENLQGKPQRYPAKYPLRRYPNSRVALAYVQPNLRPGLKNQVMLTTTDKVPQISTFYKQDLIKDGWTLKSTYENEIYSSTVWRKGNLEVEVRVSPDPTDNFQNVQLISGPVRK